MLAPHSPCKIAEHRCPRCGYHAGPTPSPYRLRRNSVLKLNRIRCNGMRCLPDDDDGRRFLMVLLALDLPDDDIANRAPWVTVQELRALEREAARFNPTPAAIGKVLKLTDAEREEHALWNIHPHDVDWKTVQRRREVDKVARRKQKRHQARAELAATASHDPRTIAIMKAMELHPYGASVETIMIDAGKVLPKNRTVRRSIVHRVLDRLEQKGLVETWCSGKPGKLVRYCKKAITPITPQNSHKIANDQGLTQNAAVTPTKISKRVAGAPANQPCRMTHPSSGKPRHDVVTDVVRAAPSQRPPSMLQANGHDHEVNGTGRHLTPKQAAKQDRTVRKVLVYLGALEHVLRRDYGDTVFETAMEHASETIARQERRA
jgi:hypothetical protein